MDKARYSVVVCDTTKSKRINYRIRYQVYCLEKGYEDIKQFPIRMETDRYDACSVHFIVRDNISNKWVGACRLVILPFNKLPLLQHCSISDTSYQKFSVSAEISRLCAIASSRRGTWNMLTMMLNVLQHYCLDHELHHCFSLHNKALARIVRSLNINIEAISEDCEFHGQRRAYYHNCMPANIKTENVTDYPYQFYSKYIKQYKFTLNNLKKSRHYYASN